MEEIIIESNNVFFVNNEWRYERRIVNLSTFTISYEVKKGLKTKEEAVQFKEIDDKQFQKDLKKIKRIANAEYTFKEYSARLLKIPKFFFSELESKKKYNQVIIRNAKKRGANVEEEYISLSHTGTRKKKTALLAAVKRVCKEALVPEISVHTLRHQFATILLEKEVPLEQISHLLGHKSVTTTLNIYCGIMDAREGTKDVISTFAPYVNDGE